MAERPDLAVVVIGFQAPAELADPVRSVLDQNIPLIVWPVRDGHRSATTFWRAKRMILETVPAGRGYFPAHADDGGLRMMDVSANRRD